MGIKQPEKFRQSVTRNCFQVGVIFIMSLSRTIFVLYIKKLEEKNIHFIFTSVHKRIHIPIIRFEKDQTSDTLRTEKPAKMWRELTKKQKLVECEPVI